MHASIIIRTYNEAKHLPSLLQSISEQRCDFEYEIIVVDSGSEDQTLSIAKGFDTNIITISKEDFTFGRSLNLGCEKALGDYLVFISGHCIPQNSSWLRHLVSPLSHKEIAYCYGRQVGNEESRFSECQIFRKYYPEESKIPQKGFFCNNANAAIKRKIWKRYRFNENLTGLEDMELAKRLYEANYKTAYVAEASVLHLHNESWHKVRMRYQREAVALRNIMPDVYIRFTDFIRFYISAIFIDSYMAMKEKKLSRNLKEIIIYRLMQYWGSYRGNHEYKKLSSKLREEYFYPK